MSATRLFKPTEKNVLKFHSLVNMETDKQNIELMQKSPLELSVDREFAGSMFPQLSGAIANLMRDEEAKPTPNQEKLEFYILASKALARRDSAFSPFSTNDVTNIFETLSPILKKLSKSKSSIEDETIFESNEQVFIDLINYILNG